jgi:hypothetical protein
MADPDRVGVSLVEWSFARRYGWIVVGFARLCLVNGTQVSGYALSSYIGWRKNHDI